MDTAIIVQSVICVFLAEVVKVVLVHAIHVIMNVMDVILNAINVMVHALDVMVVVIFVIMNVIQIINPNLCIVHYSQLGSFRYQ